MFAEDFCKRGLDRLRVRDIGVVRGDPGDVVCVGVFLLVFLEQVLGLVCCFLLYVVLADDPSARS